MSAEQNKNLIRRWIATGWNSGDYSLVDTSYAPDYFIHDPNTPGFAGGRAAFKQYINTLRVALPDVKFTIEDMVADGDTVTWRFTARATHSGPLLGIPATGKFATVAGVVISRFSSDGMWAEDWVNWDALGLLQQIGVIPSAA